MDFNAVLTVRFRKVLHMCRYEFNPPHLISGTTLPCQSGNTENACAHKFIF